MTRAAARTAPRSATGMDDHQRSPAMPSKAEQDLLAGLWQEANFSRLPDDAPPEVRSFVKDIENPRRVYAIHRASRRHDFQLLVDLYIQQLRYGCDADRCTTPTCFTCRRQLAGTKPIRRYNPTSARILAVYLASQDSPESDLCPNLSKPRDSSSTANNLIFSTRPVSPRADETSHTSRPLKGPPPLSSSSSSRSASKHAMASPPRSPRSPSSPKSIDFPKTDVLSSRERLRQKVSISEKPVSKDHRSFAATAFGTAAFKMLEWLTPQSLQSISQKVTEVVISPQLDTPGTSSPNAVHSTPSSASLSDGATNGSLINTTPIKPPKLISSTKDIPEVSPSQPRPDEPRWRRNSETKNAVKRRSFESKSMPTELRSVPRTTPKQTPTSTHHDKPVRRSKPETTSGVQEVTLSPPFFENVPVPLQHLDTFPSEDETIDELQRVAVQCDGKVAPAREVQEPITSSPVEEDNTELSVDLPQSLTQLNVELIDFICDVYHEDATSEQHPATLVKNTSDEGLKPQKPPIKLIRQQGNQTPLSRQQWKTFNEQVLFDVLSHPDSLVSSFTQNGQLFDSQTLWYCMVRLTRSSPSLVLHSLWLAAGSLFVPPRAVQSQLASMRKFNPRQTPLTDHQASCIMATCLHALVALAPVITESRMLYDMSRIRSNGLALSSLNTFPRTQLKTSIEYDDIFSDELAIRLARRLCCALTAQRCFSKMTRNMERATPQRDILDPLLDQLDLLNTGPIRILEFSDPERLMHETRVPTLLLDWARAVLLDEWNGDPEFDNQGPFSGALALMATLHRHRNILLLGDIQFRVDYFSDRLDAMHIPIAWVSHDFDVSKKLHILDFPYLFRPETLVSFFRSINFSRMSRMFEEASSLRNRMKAIVEPGSLITNPHHKTVLQDMLSTASSRYLVLEIDRNNVLRDAWDQLWRRQERELLRPLKVKLGEKSGEEGFDSGGVQQEFFRLAIAECLDPAYGAFTLDERTRMAWFTPGSLVEEWRFEMMGLLMSLAVYNGLTLPVTFPRALYRKLLNEPVCELYHIADGWPELASGLTTLLEWDEKDGLVEDVFARTYDFSVPGVGRNVTHEMVKEDFNWPQGIPSADGNGDETEAPLVTNNNRDDYVSDYIRYLTDVSIQPQFEAFERGFRTCLDKKPLTLLTPPILQSIVEGVQEIDISELKRYARYVGWDASHRSIRDFWSIVKRFDDRLKRQLLEFVTASDRVPVGGLRNLQFVIQKNGEEEEGGHLPTAYTCYGTLLLPEYKNKEMLRERLCMALENAQGFGFA